MDGRGVFRGFALQNVDAKGRVAIPYALRQTIELNSQVKTAVVAKLGKSDGLTGYDRNFLPEAGDRNENRINFGLTEEANYDDSGRMVIPPMLRKLGKIENLAFFIGTGERFEIWNPAIALASDEIDDDVKEIIRFCLEDKGITL
ncbi:division/cell wall cluster transcriptional repressor MraZ [Sphingomonas sp. ID0503]|uniref:division/cell wall cluster transcriptional repressor MraZ n=1 Tax=Sphingomonas sp. ID0503 TaxID=3399691 RepID=UPI003AFA9B83